MDVEMTDLLCEHEAQYMIKRQPQHKLPLWRPYPECDYLVDYEDSVEIIYQNEDYNGLIPPHGTTSLKEQLNSAFPGDQDRYIWQYE